mgnify:CR=1
MSSSLTILYDDHTVVSCLLLESRALSCKAVRALKEHELNLTLQKFAETGANTIVVPANMRGFEMILPTDKLAQQ